MGSGEVHGFQAGQLGAAKQAKGKAPLVKREKIKTKANYLFGGILETKPRQSSKSQSSCLGLPSAGIIGTEHQAD